MKFEEAFDLLMAGKPVCVPKSTSWRNNTRWQLIEGKLVESKNFYKDIPLFVKN